MATNANANGIPFLKRTGIPPAIKNSMVVYYDIKKQGCTNENMKANPVLKDFSGNGNDGQCNNFAWNHESGIGEFVFKDFVINGNNVKIKENIITINANPDRYGGGIELEYTKATRDTPSTKVRITGIKDTIYLNYVYRDSEGKEHTLKITKDGNYNFPKSFNIIEGNGAANSLYLYNPNEIETIITIEQLDYYKDAICTDGVDDYIESILNNPSKESTVIFDCDWDNNDVYSGITTYTCYIFANGDVSLKTYIKNKGSYTVHPKSIIAVTTNDEIYDNNLDVILNDKSHSDADSTLTKLYIGGKVNDTYNKMYLRRIAIFDRVLTADEIKYVYEKIFGCKLKTMEERVEDSIILHYDVAKQDATNDSMKSDPRLIDLSGHGYDAKLNNFAWTEDSGINTTTYPNALVFDGVDDYGIVEDIPMLMPEVGFTVIAKRKILDTGKYCIASCSPGTNLGAFLFEIGQIGSHGPAYPKTYAYSFGLFNNLNLNEDNDISYMTSKVYNGTSINTGSDNSVAPLVIGRRGARDGRILKGVIYSFMLFNRDLTTEEIEFVKQKYFSD